MLFSHEGWTCCNDHFPNMYIFPICGIGACFPCFLLWLQSNHGKEIRATRIAAFSFVAGLIIAWISCTMYSPTKLRLQLYLHSYLHLNRLIFLYMWASRHLGDWEGESDGLVAVSFPCPLWILSGSKTFPQRQKQTDRLVSLANVFQICPHFKKCWHHCNFCAALCIWHGCMRLPSSAWAGVTVRGSPLLGLSNTQALFSPSGPFCIACYSPDTSP